jgi:hypothetical protein
MPQPAGLPPPLSAAGERPQRPSATSATGAAGATGGSDPGSGTPPRTSALSRALVGVVLALLVLVGWLLLGRA